MTEPTEAELERIKEWPYDQPGWLAFCVSLWNTDYGAVRESDDRVELITGGWSDNEDIIAAMQENWRLWSQAWESSHRGGLFVFRKLKKC